MFNISYNLVRNGLTTDPTDRSTGGANLPQVHRRFFEATTVPRWPNRAAMFLTANFVYDLPFYRSQQGPLLATYWAVGRFLAFRTFPGPDFPLRPSWANGKLLWKLYPQLPATTPLAQVACLAHRL